MIALQEAAGYHWRTNDAADLAFNEAGPQPPLSDLLFLAWLRSYFVGAPSVLERRPFLPFQEVRRHAP
jgi:hypothetical protein